MNISLLEELQRRLVRLQRLVQLSPVEVDVAQTHEGIGSAQWVTEFLGDLVRRLVGMQRLIQFALETIDVAKIGEEGFFEDLVALLTGYLHACMDDLFSLAQIRKIKQRSTEVQVSRERWKHLNRFLIIVHSISVAPCSEIMFSGLEKIPCFTDAFSCSLCDLLFESGECCLLCKFTVWSGS